MLIIQWLHPLGRKNGNGLLALVESAASHQSLRLKKSSSTIRTCCKSVESLRVAIRTLSSSLQIAIPDLKHRVQGLVSLHFVRESLHCLHAEATLVPLATRRACCISNVVCTLGPLVLLCAMRSRKWRGQQLAMFQNFIRDSRKKTLRLIQNRFTIIKVFTVCGAMS